MSVYLFAGRSVSDFTLAQAWYEQLFGSALAFLPNDAEAGWELAGHRYVYIEHRSGHAGHSMVTLLVTQLDEAFAGDCRPWPRASQEREVRQRGGENLLPRS